MRSWEFFLTTAEFAEFGAFFDQEFFTQRPPRLVVSYLSSSLSLESTIKSNARRAQFRVLGFWLRVNAGTETRNSKLPKAALDN
jgi:hypothetical protein